MKSTTYKGRTITAHLTSQRGHYKLETTFYKRPISCIITDAETYDWLDDKSKPHLHAEAKRYAYAKLKQTYKVDREDRWWNNEK